MNPVLRPPSSGPNASGVDGPPRREILQLLDRIAESKHFARARRLQDFLRYVCEKALDNRLAEITEQQIGHRVFGRSQDYNPSEDNIVRVEARDLRKRLEEYFAEDGALEALLVDIPKGTYVPRFVSRAAKEMPAREAEAQTRKLRRGRSWIWASWALLVLLAGVSIWLALELHAARSSGVPQAGHSAAHRFWAQALRPDRPSVLCVADSSFALLQDLTRRNVPFQDYATGRFFASLRSAAPASETARLLSEVALRHHTSLADAALVARVLGMKPAGTQVAVRFARDLRTQDLKAQNLVLLGSERSNPWSALFDSWRGFRVEYDPTQHRPLVRNKSPQGDELGAYLSGPPGERPYDAYGVITFLPNLDWSGNVVIIAGTNMQGTEAAGEFLTIPEKFDELLRVLGAASANAIPYFEAVLKLVAVETSSVSCKIVAHRLIDSRKLEEIRYTDR